MEIEEQENEEATALKGIEKMAISKQKKSIFLWVVKDNNPARIFYERNGFMFDGEEKNFENSLVKLMCYRKELIY